MRYNGFKFRGRDRYTEVGSAREKHPREEKKERDESGRIRVESTVEKVFPMETRRQERESEPINGKERQGSQGELYEK